MTSVIEENLSSKVAELMTTLDQVKKYKELAKSLVDFVLILFSSVVVVLFVYIGFDMYQGSGWQVPQGLVLSGVESLIALFIFLVAFIAGIFWVDRRIRRVKVGEWKKIEESNIGALKILAELDWPSVFQDIRYSKMGFVFYSMVKIIGYWILAFLIIFIGTEVGLSFLHVQLSITYTAIFSLIVALVLSRKDLQRRYNQSWALDSLLWELRWFDSEFRRKAGEIGSTTKA